MPDLTTTFLGLKLKNPLVASSSPLSKKVERISAMQEAGISAVVLYSLFEEQIIHESLELDHFLTRGTYTYAEALTYFPDLDHYNLEPDKYLELIQKAKETVEIPIIASLNGISSGGWVEYGQRIEQAGADALELNLYYLATDKNLPAADLENAYADLVATLYKSIKIPLTVKLSPAFTSLPHLAQRLAQAGAKGLTLFNRFYQPDLDIENLTVNPALELSTQADILLPLRWIAILYGRVPVDFALTSGIHKGKDLIKAMLAGARVGMVASELIANGIPRAQGMLDEMQKWMEAHEYESVHQMQGAMSQQRVEEPAAFERANYMKALTKFDNHLP